MFHRESSGPDGFIQQYGHPASTPTPSGSLLHKKPVLPLHQAVCVPQTQEKSQTLTQILDTTTNTALSLKSLPIATSLLHPLIPKSMLAAPRADQQREFAS